MCRVRRRPTPTGEYLFLEVPVGSYEIDVNQAGFKKFVRKDIVVDLNAVVGVDIALTVGGSTETVEVLESRRSIDTTTTQLGAVVNIAFSDGIATEFPRYISIAAAAARRAVATR